MKILIVSCCLVFFCSCQNGAVSPPLEKLNQKTSLEVISEFPTEVISGLNKQGSADGALSRNNPSYFHVRFQVDIAFIAAHAVYFKNETSLLNAAQCIEYSFNHQRPEGDFEVVVPEALQYLGDPVPSDLASGISFFGSALGFALAQFNQSAWYNSLPITQKGKSKIINQLQRMKLMMEWLKKQEQVLMLVDKEATNRLFWDARCYYSMGKYLNDPGLLAIGEKFLQSALAKQSNEGFFMENGGFDSSYNGVSLLIGLNVYSELPIGKLKEDLGSALVRCAQWQRSRIMSSGEISLEGNTRVYPGGEFFLGQEKSVAWIDTVLAMYWLMGLTENKEYGVIAGRLREFYQ